jgi:hypothetical protein
MKQVRIIDFLRNCPVYTRLYSPLYGYCEFLECSDDFIFVRGSKPDSKHNKCGDTVYKFNEIGQPAGTVYEDNEIEYSECMLFPSHTYKSWKNWQEHLFKDGDIIVENTADEENRNMFKYKHFDVCYGYNGIPFVVPPSELKKYRYATKEEQIRFRELQEKFEKDNSDTKKQLDLKETVEITNNIIKKQAKTWGRLHPAYALAENMGLLDDDDILEDMYEKHRTDTFRVVCELFCCDPKEVLRKMLEHRNEVMPKIMEAEKRSIAEANAKVPDKMFHADDIIIDRTLGTGYLHLLKVKGYDSAGKYWVCFDSDGTYYALTQDEINKYEYATEQEMADFKELQEKFEKENEKKTTDYSKFYYIENTVDESDTEITVYCKTMEEALERIKTCRDWYGEMGTGRIYEVKFGKSPIGKLVYSKE